MNAVGSLRQLLSNLHAEVVIRADEESLEATADSFDIRASLYRLPIRRTGRREEWHSVSGIDGRSLSFLVRTGGNSAIVHMLDRALTDATRRVVEACVLDRAVMPSLPFALFALDHADGRDDDKHVAAMREMWVGSGEQHSARLDQARRLMHWARWAP